MRIRLAALASIVASLLAPGLAGCATAAAPAGSAQGKAAPEPSGGAPVEASSSTPEGSGPVPPKKECDAFLDVIARTTTLRAAIHLEPATAPKADGWATECERLATEAKALPLANPDLVIENANLATRLGDLAKDLRALARAAKAGDGPKKAEAHRRVLGTSEQVEVITREPAARCAGDPKKLMATSGRLPAAVIQRAIRERLPVALQCYEAGLARDPKLAGRVLVRLVIGLDGKVADASLATAGSAQTADVVTPSDPSVPAMPDAKVSACVVEALRGAVFPPPDGGTISVVYPVVLSRTP